MSTPSVSPITDHVSWSFEARVTARSFGCVMVAIRQDSCGFANYDFEIYMAVLPFIAGEVVPTAGELHGPLLKRSPRQQPQPARPRGRRDRLCRRPAGRHHRLQARPARPRRAAAPLARLPPHPPRRGPHRQPRQRRGRGHRGDGDFDIRRLGHCRHAGNMSERCHVGPSRPSHVVTAGGDRDPSMGAARVGLHVGGIPFGAYASPPDW